MKRPASKSIMDLAEESARKSPPPPSMAVEELSSEEVDSEVVLGGGPSDQLFVRYGPDDWAYALSQCYDEATQIKLCRAHANSLSARAAARKKLGISKEL